MGPVGPVAPAGPAGPVGPVEPVILGKKIAYKNAVHLNRFELGVDFYIFHNPTQFVSKLKLDTDTTILMYLDMVYKFY